jgi:hypothetical protein
MVFTDATPEGIRRAGRRRATRRARSVGRRLADTRGANGDRAAELCSLVGAVPVPGTGGRLSGLRCDRRRSAMDVAIFDSDTSVQSPCVPRLAATV